MGKGALRAVPTIRQALTKVVGTLRFAHPRIFDQRSLQTTEIIRHIAELAQQFRVAEFTHHGIAAAAEGDSADAAGHS